MCVPNQFVIYYECAKFLRSNLIVYVVCIIFIGACDANSSSTNTPQSNLEMASNWHIASSSEPANILWTKSFTSLAGFLAANSETVVIERNSQLTALSPISGDLLWDYSPRRPVRNVTAIEDGYLLAICCTQILRLNNQGQEVWRSQEFSTKIFEPVLSVIGQEVYFSDEDRTHVLSLVEGTALREFFVDRTKPAVRGNYRVYESGEIVLNVATDGSHINAFHVTKGEIVWSVTEQRGSNVLLVKDRLLLFTASGELKTYDMLTGYLVQQVKLRREERQNAVINQSVDAGDFYILLAYSNGIVYLVDDVHAELVAIQLKIDT